MARLLVHYDGVQLADGNLNSSFVDEITSVNGRASVQTEELIRDDQPTYFDRNVKRNAFTLKIRKQTSGAPRSYYHALMRRQTLPGTGELVISIVADGVTRTWTAARAKCEQTDARPIGSSVVIAYAIECGKFTYESTETEPDDQIDGGTLDDMGTEILYRRGTRAAILAFIAAEDFHDAEPWMETDGGRTGVGNRGALAKIEPLATVAIAAAGTTTLALVTHATVHRALVTVAAGGGAYTANIILPQTATGLDASSVAFILGDVVELRIEIAASANPAVKIYHNAASGTALAELAGDAAVARNYIAELRHDGTQWRAWDVRQVNA